jgi:hypothetical protein
MGIDGIGKPPGGGLPPGAIGGSSGAAKPGAVRGESFRVERAEATERAQPSDALGQLQRGDISLDQYLDTRVAGAVEHLQGKLPAEQLDFVKQSLREQLSTDPVLMELVRRATGVTPAEDKR